MRHVLSLYDMTSEEVQQVLDLSSEYKSRLESGDRPALLAGHTVGLLFEKPSLRTRVSFETLTSQLGGNSLFLGSDVGWGVREPLCDFVPILTSYLDLLVIRAKSHAKVEEAVSFSRCPVINGLTDVSHPCQAFADLLTVKEIAGDNLANSHITYVGDANNVTYSLALICSKLGIRMSIAAPEGYQFDASFIDQLNEQNGSSLIRQTSNIEQAVDGANFIYTDVWTSMGQEAESKQRLKDFADYQVNEAMMSLAAPGAKFLHCLPARRGEEVASEVIDSDRSAIIQQANNRLHAQKGLVIWLLDKAS
ncbi:ornithine carbamoyltransferase [Mariniblastus fucicola]|uniref:Ornithine carbamoyltransferase n=1 Tax=Mariniblastus fucicola TaxID=980251 RepID=A0A5B9PH44_9BACT|nr:ornithine carbamoyltransferase [Mariniblastus fucicola]QEG22171.1 Ornithine carbamoyltransferase [Mariniblastus fucicola]